MEIENFEQKKQILSNLLIDGFDNANYSHKLLFKSELDDEKEFDKQKDLMCALTYLNQAHASFTNAYTFIALNDELLGGRQEFDNILHQFTEFNTEFLNNVRTNHSHQWSDIEFKRLVDFFEAASGLLNGHERIQGLSNEARK